MKLKTKLLSGMLPVLLLQALIGGGFTFYTFYYQRKNSTTDLLLGAWERARIQIEQLKHSHYRNIHVLRSYLKEHPRELTDTIRFFITTTQADRIVVLDAGRHVLCDVRINGPTEEIADINLIDLSLFSFPRNEFILSPGHQGYPLLFLITGASIWRNGSTEPLYLFLISNLNEGFISSLGFSPSIEIAFFVGNRFLLSNAPPFSIALPEPTTLQRVNIGNVPYEAYSRLLSADIHQGLYLVTLKSELEDILYLNRVLSAFVLAFFVTLLASFILATVMTTYVIGPFYTLKQWLDTYLSEGKLYVLSVQSKDEVGFLAKAFHEVVEKVLKEEQIIRQQYHQISFLNRYNESIVENLQAGIVMIDAEGRIEFCNQYFADLLTQDRETLRGADFRTLLEERFSISEGGLDLAKVSFASHFRIDRLVLLREGEPEYFVAKFIPFQDDESEAKTLVMMENTTTTETLWEKVLVAEKIASLGILSAGMAHEINNPLETIRSHVGFLKAVEDSPEKLDSLAWIERESSRIAEIVRRILSYAREGGQVEGQADVNRVVRETVDLLTQAAGKGGIEMNLDPSLPLTGIDERELKQVVLNLLLNGLQAVEGGGKVWVESTQENGKVILRVKDTGVGIKPAHLRKVFDPFFTTKAKGTGLGLSICYSILKHAAGEIQIQSQPGNGTIVEVKLRVFHNSDRR